ncbi:MAG: lipoyl domain-containing protein [Oscillospiraceae bacterium]|nr:lipoyl domain-containing protein [Oscillospiraceae bacterium]
MAKIEVVVPEFAAGAESIKLRQWFFKECDAVKKLDELAECVTDKINVFIEAPADGKLLELMAEEGDRVNVGQTVAIIETE